MRETRRATREQGIRRALRHTSRSSPMVNVKCEGGGFQYTGRVQFVAALNRNKSRLLVCGSFHKV